MAKNRGWLIGHRREGECRLFYTLKRALVLRMFVTGIDTLFYEHGDTCTVDESFRGCTSS